MKAMLFLLLSSAVTLAADMGAPIPIPGSLKNSNNPEMEGATLVQVYLLKGQRVAISEETEATVAPKGLKMVPKTYPIQTPEPPKIVPMAKANCDCQNCICEKFNGGICPCEVAKVPKQMPRTAPPVYYQPNVYYRLPSSAGTCTGPNCPRQ